MKEDTPYNAPPLSRRPDLWTPLPQSTYERTFIRLLTVLPGLNGSRLETKLDVVSLNAAAQNLEQVGHA